MSRPSLSVIVRARDKADTAEATFASIRAQTVASELIVVDSGSTDGTLEIARRWADVVVEIPSDEFSFGRALNVGAAAATGDVHAAASAHVALTRSDWLATAVAHLAREGVGAASGTTHLPDGRPMLEPFEQSFEDWRPTWGLKNTASAWRAEVWHAHPFDEVMTASEDKEWARRVLRAGWRIMLDPKLEVSAAHRRRAGLADLLRRCTAESRELVLRTGMPPVTGPAAVRRWWTDITYDDRTPPLLKRLSPYRAVEIAGSYLGSRQATRQTARSR